MARAKNQSTNLFEEGVERTKDVLNQIGEDFEELQKNAVKRRKNLEKRAEKELKRIRTQIKKNTWVKEAEKQRKAFEKRADKIRQEIEDSAPVQRVVELREDATKVVEQQVEGLLENMRIASHSDGTNRDLHENALHLHVQHPAKLNAEKRRKAA